MSALRAALVAALLLAQPLVGADDRSDGKLKALKPDQALLLLPVHSNAEFGSLTFRDDAHDETFEVEDVPARRQLVLVKAPPGSYYLKEIKLPDRRFVRMEPQERWVPKFTLKAGVLNYAGDLRIASVAGDRVTSSFGGSSLDTLPVQLRREKDLAPDLLERFPLSLVKPLDAAKLAGREPDPAWRYADWLALLPVAQPARQHALAEKTLLRLGVTLPAAGTAFEDAEDVVKKVSKRRAVLWSSPDKDELFLNMLGLWGAQGQRLGIELLFVDRKLAHAAVRGETSGDIWTLPEQDAMEDLEAFVAAPP